MLVYLFLFQFNGYGNWAKTSEVFNSKGMKGDVLRNGPGQWRLMFAYTLDIEHSWNLNITHLERKVIWTKPPLLCSILIFRGVYFLVARKFVPKSKTKLDASEFGLFEESSMGRGPLIWNDCWTDFEWFRIWIVEECGLKALFFESGRILKHNFAEFQDIDIIYRRILMTKKEKDPLSC